jgi:AraC family transcriptional regulator, regulatory protein of adaptative response / methylated-DNA-[protein]-cysteine methyltransferase
MRQLPPQSEPSFGFATSPFGECCIVFSSDGICALTFPENRESAFYDLENRFPETDFTQNDEKAARLIQLIFDKGETLTLNPIGTEFQLSVWHALQRIPAGKTTTYASIAEAIGRPKAVRAVGTAIGANPIGFLIPCHRVIRTDGGLGGFRWGLECKKKMLEWERR